MFCWSIKKHNHRYTLYIGDGDANSFAKVREKLKEKFGDDYSVTEKHCIGHIHKCMGAALGCTKVRIVVANYLMARPLVGKAGLLALLWIVSKTTMVKQLDLMLGI